MCRLQKYITKNFVPIINLIAGNGDNRVACDRFLYIHAYTCTHVFIFVWLSVVSVCT